MKPFRFLAGPGHATDARMLAERARRAEALGIDVLVLTDHLIDQLAPIPALASVAAATDRLRLGTFVFNNDLRHPAVLAQDLATLDVLSAGRLQIGIGAGWNEPEYEAIGLPFDRVPVRQMRLGEALHVLKGCLGPDAFSFAGEHYTIRDYDARPKPVQQPHPPLLVGGGGRRTLELAAREAQIVGLAPRILGEQRTDPRSITVEGTMEKIDWVRPAVTDHARAEAAKLVDRLRHRTGVELTEDEVLESPHVFIGSIDGLAGKLQRQRDQLGISSIMVGELGDLDPLVERLAGI